MFDIAFLAGEPPYINEEGCRGRWGRTVLGDFEERFIAPVEWWHASDYQRQWILGAQRLLDGARESAFTLEAGRLWWTAWRDGTEVVIQQRYLLGDEMAAARSAMVDSLPYELVGPRETHSEGGEAISEWRVCLDEIREFVERRAGAYVPG